MPGHWLENRGAAQGGLIRAIVDSGWGQLLRYRSYTAEGAGRELVAVDPRCSSLEGAACGHTERKNRVSQAVFICRRCGHRTNADVDAARVILGRGLARHESAQCVNQLPAARR